MTVTNQEWNEKLNEKTSDMYKNLESQLIIEVALSIFVPKINL